MDNVHSSIIVLGMIVVVGLLVLVQKLSQTMDVGWMFIPLLFVLFCIAGGFFIAQFHHNPYSSREKIRQDIQEKLKQTKETVLHDQKERRWK